MVNHVHQSHHRLLRHNTRSRHSSSLLRHHTPHNIHLPLQIVEVLLYVNKELTCSSKASQLEWYSFKEGIRSGARLLEGSSLV